jgi:hypothetical protein
MATSSDTGSNSMFGNGGIDPSVASIFNYNGLTDGLDKAPPITQELGTTGVPIYAGRVYDEWDPRLQGDLAIRVYREMQTYPIVASFLFGIDQLIRRVKFDVEPHEGEDPEGLPVTLVDSAMHDMSMSWADVLSQNFSMVPYGWSYSEIVYKRREGFQPRGVDSESGRPLPSSKYRDGMFGWRKIALRTQETRWRWEIDDEGGTQGMWQSAPPDYKPRYIPIERALLFRTSVLRPSPEGLSVLRGAYSPFYLAKRFQRVEGIGVERDLAGLPYIGVPPEILRSDATPDQVSLREALKSLVTGIRRDEKEGFLYPLQYDDKGNKLYEIGLLSSGGTRQFDTDAIIGRYNQQIAMTVMADFLLLGHEEVGSYNLGASKVDMFTTALQTYLDGVAGVYNSHAIPRLMAVNGLDPETSPKLIPGKVSETDFGSLGLFLQQLSAAGAELFPNDTLLRTLLRRADLPDDLPEADRDATDLFGGDLPPSFRRPVPPSPDGTAAQPDGAAVTGGQPPTGLVGG